MDEPPYSIACDASGRTLVRDSVTGCLCLTLSPAEARDLAQRLLALAAAATPEARRRPDKGKPQAGAAARRARHVHK